MPARTMGWSSASKTRADLGVLFIRLGQRWFAPLERKPGMHFGALAGSRAKGEFAPCQGGPFFHAHQTEAGAAQGPLAQGCDVEADAVIAHREMKLAVLLAQFHGHDSGLGM